MGPLFVFVLLLCLALGACSDTEYADDTATPTAEPTAVATQTPGLATFGAAATPPADIASILTADLAARLAVASSDITLISLEPVVWPDTCLGVSAPDRVCAQAITPGWLAVMRGPDAREYRYHGSASRFVFVESP